MESDLDELKESFGLGDLPIISEANKKLNQALIAKQLEAAALEAELDHENDSVEQLHAHAEAVAASSRSHKAMILAKKDELASEKDLERIALLQQERNAKDLKTLTKALEKNHQDLDDLHDKLELRATVLELLEEEHATDQAKLKEWRGQEEEFEGGIMELLHSKYQDDMVIKETRLKLEKLQSECDKAKAILDEASTAHKMAQLSLDKTAADYRRLHDERQSLLVKWQESVALSRRRGAELQDLYDQMSKIKDQVRQKNLELQKQINFRTAERQNNVELQRQIDETERKATRLRKELEAKEQTLDKIESDLVLEERETMKLGADIATKRTKLKELKRLKQRMMTKIDSLTKALESAQGRRHSLESSSTTAGQKAEEISDILKEEEAKRDKLQWDLDKVREVKFKKEQALKDMEKEEEALQVQIKAQEKSVENLKTRIRQGKETLAKKEELILALDSKIAQLDHDIRILQGVTSAENRAELKAEIDKAKATLAQRQSDQRSLNHLVHKIEAEVRKMDRSIDAANRQAETLKGDVDELTKTGDVIKRNHDQWMMKVEELVLEDKLLMVNEKKAKEDLKLMNLAMLELEKQTLISADEAKKERAELISQKELLMAQQKHLREDVRIVQAEIRERKERADKLKIKYHHMIKAMGDSNQFNDDRVEIPSHAFHLVEIAQERAELQDKCQELKDKIVKDEAELLDLEKAAAMVKNSNEKYRALKVNKPLTPQSEEEKALQEKIKAKTNAVEELKNQISAMESEVKLKEFQMLKCDSDLERVQALYDEKATALDKVKKEVTDQVVKLNRAQKIVATLSSEMKTSNPSAVLYEKDMDLRLAKESQRSALIKLKELSLANAAIGEKVKTVIKDVGVTSPTLTRVEIQHLTHKANSARPTRPRTKSSSRAGSLYRYGSKAKRSNSISDLSSRSSQSTPSSANGRMMTSMLVMELSTTSKSNGMTQTMAVTSN